MICPSVLLSGRGFSVLMFVKAEKPLHVQPVLVKKLFRVCQKREIFVKGELFAQNGSMQSFFRGPAVCNRFNLLVLPPSDFSLLLCLT